MEIQPGMIGLQGGNHFIQKAIRFFTRSIWSHSFTVVDWPDGEMSTNETTATITKSAALYLKLMEPDWTAMFEPIASDAEKRQAWVYAYKRHSGQWYGYLSYLWFMYRAVARLVGYEPTRVWTWANGGITCTEYTVTYLSAINKEFMLLFLGRDLNAYAPQELYQILVTNPKMFRFVGWVKMPSYELSREVPEITLNIA
jgi:hypothetical protein